MQPYQTASRPHQLELVKTALEPHDRSKQSLLQVINK